MDYRLLSVDIRREVPGLHPGLNDLIRVLGKQAHCASRTLIVCDPVCPKPSYSESKYHKNCASPKKGRSWDSLCRPSSLWSPVRPETYYYDCFFYRQYPDRDSEYQEIEEKYNAIKQQKLDFSPPECDEDQIKAIVSGVKINKAAGMKYTTFGDMNKSSTGNGARGPKIGRDVDDWYGSGGYKKKDKYGESSMGSARNPKYSPGGSKKDMDLDEDSVPCAELAEIRDLLKRSDRETIRRMQEMLTLMKELSVRDICRATCDGSLPGGRSKVGHPRSAKSEEELYTSQESKTLKGIGPRKRKADPSDYELQDRETRYQQRGESVRQSRESGSYGQQGLKKGNQQRDDGYEPQRSMQGYKQREDEYGQQGRKKGYQQRDRDIGEQRPKKKYQKIYDDDDYGTEGPQRSYQQLVDDDYGPQGRKKGYQQRDEGYERDRSVKDYQQRGDVYGPRELKKPYHRDSDISRRKRGKYDDDDVDADNYYTVEHQESETSYQMGKSLKKDTRKADDRRESIKSSQQRGSSQKGKKNIADDEIPAEFDGEYDDEDNAGSQLDLDIQEPRSLQRHLASTSRSRGKVGDDNESLTSTSSDRSRTSARGERPSSKRGKMNDQNAASESDTDVTDSSSSIHSESATTDASGRTRDGETDSDVSDMDDFEALGKASSSRSLKRHQDGSLSSSQASLPGQGSATSLGRTKNKDQSRPGLSIEQKSPKQSRIQGSASAGAPDEHGSGVDYKIPVGKKNVPLTVHEVVELSNKITDVLVLEVINQLLRQGLYSPPSSRYLQPPEATMPRTSAESSKKSSSSSSRQRVDEQRASDGRREPSGYQQISTDVNMKSIGSPTRLSTIDELSSRTGLSKEPSRKDGSTRDMRPGEQRPSGESKRSSCPRHSRSLSPSISSGRRSSFRSEIERRAKSEGDRYKDTLRPGDVVPPKPWERQFSSQMKEDSVRDSLKGQTKGRSDMPESRGASMTSQKSKTGSHKPSNTRSDSASLRDSTADRSYPERQPTLPGSRQNSPLSSPRSTRQYDGPCQERSHMPGSRGASISSQRSKAGSYKPSNTRSDPASLRDSTADGSYPGRQLTLSGSRQNSPESSPRSTRQYERPPQDRSGMPGGRGASASSQMSKTGSYKGLAARSEQASLKYGRLSGQPPTLPGSRRNLQESSPRSTRQYEGLPQDRYGMPGSHGASISSQMSKTASYRSQSTRPGLASLKNDILPESHQTSISSRMSKQSQQRPPGRTDSHQPDSRKDGSLSRPRIEGPVGPGKMPSDLQSSKEKSRLGILKDRSLLDATLESEPLPVAGLVPVVTRFEPDNTSSAQRIIGTHIRDQPMVKVEKDPSKGRVVRISRSENMDIYVPEPEAIDAGAIRATSEQRLEPCQPDDFIATNYDTDNTTLYYARITNNAFPPVKETYHAAGFMLRSAYNYNIPPRSKINVKTDLLMQLPRNCYGRIAPRKCLVENYGIDVGAEVIDRDYKGNITVVLFNHGEQPFTVERGNKVAQLICESIHLAKVVENSNLLK